MVAARTAPNRSVRFGGEHDVLDHRGRRDARALADQLASPACRSGPELSVTQTAAVVASAVEVTSALRTLAVGRWTGLSPQDVPEAELAAWFSDPDWAGHGGESVAAFVERIRDAVADAGDGVLVVAKPVAQALLCPAPASFFAVDLRPASIHDLAP